MTKRKSISYLIEAELEKATVLLAAKAITDNLQRIAEQLAKMDANDVMPLGDSMRDLFGADQAASFEQAVSEKLRALTEQVRNTKNEISDQIDALESGQPQNDLGNMGDDDMFGGEGEDEAPEAMGPTPAEGEEAEGGDADPFGMGGGAGEGDTDADMGSFDDAFDMGGAAGRPTKESYVRKEKAIREGADRRLTREFSKLLREGKSAGEAAKSLAETYAIDIGTVAKIITKVTKG